MNYVITDYNVGDKVVITKRSLEYMEMGNRSILYHPSDSFVKTAKETVGVVGTVTHRFRPGYEMTVEFANGVCLHMKDHWVERFLP